MSKIELKVDDVVVFSQDTPVVAPVIETVVTTDNSGATETFVPEVQPVVEPTP